jgi:hypothetical protein
MNVRFCGVCRSLILADFQYCPYCGVPVSRGPGIEEALEGPFARIAGDAAKREALVEFEALGQRLDRLEADMDGLITEHAKTLGTNGEQGAELEGQDGLQWPQRKDSRGTEHDRLLGSGHHKPLGGGRRS